MHISIDFHLFQFRQTFTLSDGSQKVMEYKSHGGRLTLLTMLICFIYSYINNVPFDFWYSFRIGFAAAIVWDLITIGIYFYKVSKCRKQLEKLMTESIIEGLNDMVSNENTVSEITPDTKESTVLTNMDAKIAAIEEEFAESFAMLEEMEKEAQKEQE